MYIYLNTSKSWARQLLFLSFPRWRLVAGNASAFLGENLTKSSFLPIFVSFLRFCIFVGVRCLGVNFVRQKIYQLLTQCYQRTWPEVYGRFGFQGFREFWKVQRYWRFRSLEGFFWRIWDFPEGFCSLKSLHQVLEGSEGIWKVLEVFGKFKRVWVVLRFWKFPKVREIWKL